MIKARRVLSLEGIIIFVCSNFETNKTIDAPKLGHPLFAKIGLTPCHG